MSKEDDGKNAAEAGWAAIRREGIQADAERGFLEAMKSAHARPAIGA